MTWNCSACTFENPSERAYCAICDTPHADAPSSSLADSPSEAATPIPACPPPPLPSPARPSVAAPHAALRAAHVQRRAMASSVDPASLALQHLPLRAALRATVADTSAKTYLASHPRPRVPLGDRLRRHSTYNASAITLPSHPPPSSSFSSLITSSSSSSSSSSSTLILPLDTLPLGTSTQLVGGKAAGLAKLMRLSRAGDEDDRQGFGAAPYDRARYANVRVPAAAVITTEAYTAHVAEMRPQLEALLHASEDVTEAALCEVRRRIVAKPLDAALERLVAAFLQSLPPSCPSVAVRSSSTQEDEADASWAGQYETFLNVPRAAPEVALAIKRCWASVWELRSIAYRQRRERQASARRPLPAMAVVVQRQLDPSAAGVLFTLDPVTGSDEHFVVESVWGLGEGVVGGEISPHTFTVSWRDASIVKQKVTPQAQKYAFRKHHHDTIPDSTSSSSESSSSSSSSETSDSHVAGAGGGHYVGLVPTDAHEAAAASLSEEELKGLVALGVTVAGVSGHPQDIEWAVEGGEIYLLQTRNVTAYAVAPPQTLAHLGFFDAGLFTLSKCSGAYCELLKRESAGALPLPACPLLSIHFSRVYIVQQFWWDYFRLKEARQTPLSELVAQYVPMFEAIKERSLGFAPLYQSIFQQGFDFTTDGELTAAFKQLNQFQEDIDCLSYTVGELVEHCENLLKSYLGWLNTHSPSDDQHVKIEHLVLGVNSDSDPKRSSELLSRAAAALITHPDVHAHYATASTAAAAAAPHPKVAQWVDAYVERFFYMSSADEDLSAVRFKEDPSTSLSILQSLLRAAARQPLAASPQEVPEVPRISFFQPEPIVLDDADDGFSTEFIKTLQALDAACLAESYGEAEASNHQDYLSQIIVEGLRKFLWWKETIHTLYVWSGYFNRRMLCEMCLRAGFASRSGPYWNGFTITESHPLWAMPAPEVRSLFAPTEDLAALATDRNFELFRGWVTKRVFFANFPPPSALKAGKRCAVKTAQKDVSPDAAVITGLGASAGQVSGRARVILSLKEAGEVQKDEILVTRYTDPSWTPLFSLISAVVIEEGGSLSHAAVVARELGICAVTQVKHATKLIRTGDLILVDGSTGQIQKIEQ